MIRIAENLAFMQVRVVMVCAKADIGRKMGHQKTALRQIGMTIFGVRQPSESIVIRPLIDDLRFTISDF